MTYTVIFTLPEPTCDDVDTVHVAHVTATSAEHASQRVASGIPRSRVCFVFGNECLPLKSVPPGKLWVL